MELRSMRNSGQTGNQNWPFCGHVLDGGVMATVEDLQNVWQSSSIDVLDLSRCM